MTPIPSAAHSGSISRSSLAIEQVDEVLHADLFAAAERITVRRIEEIDAGFERPLDERPALLLAEAPGVIAAVAAAVAHAAQADPRHVEAGAAELDVFHRRSITPLPVDDVTQRPTVAIGAEIVAEHIHTAVAVLVAAVLDIRRDQHPAVWPKHAPSRPPPIPHLKHHSPAPRGVPPPRG